MTDAELQAHIVECAERMTAAHRQYEATGDFMAANDAHRAWNAERDAHIEKGRRA